MPVAAMQREFHNIFRRIGTNGAAMDWDRISGNWAHWRARIQERWGRLTNDELDRIAGRRDRLVRRIQESYGLGRVEAERQLRNWERNLLAVEEFDEAELILDDDDESSGMNGRG
jgi:uncharacterized protein YjbJ (UPF0337 family)